MSGVRWKVRMKLEALGRTWRMFWCSAFHGHGPWEFEMPTFFHGRVTCGGTTTFCARALCTRCGESLLGHTTVNNEVLERVGPRGVEHLLETVAKSMGIAVGEASRPALLRMSKKRQHYLHVELARRSAEIGQLQARLCRWYSADGSFVQLRDPETVAEMRVKAAKDLVQLENYRAAAIAARKSWGDGPRTMQQTASWANEWAPLLLRLLENQESHDADRGPA